MKPGKKIYNYEGDDKSQKLNEPAEKYNDTAPTLQVILGGRYKRTEATPDFNDIEIIQMSRNGLEKNTLTSLSRFLGINMEQMATLLQTTYRNLLRKDGNTVLDSYKTEKVLELAAFAKRGIEVIGSEKGFQEWLQQPIAALDFKKPLYFLDTTFGILLVQKVLGRLEQGVYS